MKVVTVLRVVGCVVFLIAALGLWAGVMSCLFATWYEMAALMAALMAVRSGP